MKTGPDERRQVRVAPGRGMQLKLSRMRAPERVRRQSTSMASPVERKLTTILSADVFGYSRLMGQDEAATLATLKTYRDAIADLVASHRGRIFSMAGDGVLAEFASVVTAVECGVRIQRDVAERNATLPEERQMWFRIGINLGDVIVEGRDLYGEGVNIAARLQALADPGGVLISGTVFEHVKNKLTLSFDYLGPRSVKNIAVDVPIYRVLLDPDAVAPIRRDKTADGAKGVARERSPRLRRFYRSAALAGLIVALVFSINMLSWNGELWFQWPTLGVLFLLGLRTIVLFRR
jgi:adenylate cyclase